MTVPVVGAVILAATPPQQVFNLTITVNQNHQFRFSVRLLFLLYLSHHSHSLISHTQVMLHGNWRDCHRWRGALAAVGPGSSRALGIISEAEDQPESESDFDSDEPLDA